MMPVYSGIIEALHYPLYDTESLSTESIQLFRQPIGEKKNYIFTNMIMSSMLPSPEKFTIKRFPEILLTKNDKLLPFLDHWSWTKSCFELFVNHKIYIRGPLWTFAHRFVVVKGFERYLDLTESDRKTFDDFRQKLVYDIPIHPLDPFYATITSQFSDPDIEIYVGFDGTWERSI